MKALEIAEQEVRNVTYREVFPESQGPQHPQPSPRHKFTLRDHGYGAGASCAVPAYALAFAGVLISPTHAGMARLSWVVVVYAELIHQPADSH